MRVVDPGLSLVPSDYGGVMSVSAVRAGMLSGVVSALLLFFGASLMFSSTPNTANKSADEVAQEWADWIDDSGHRASALIGGFLVILAAIALIWFACTLAARLARASQVMIGFAILAGAGLAVGAAGPLALTGGHAFGDDPVPTDGNVIFFVFSLAFPLILAVFGLAASAFIATVVVVGRRDLPMWLVVFGWIAVAAGIAAVEFVPIVLVLLWLIAAGIYGAVRPVAAPAPG
jgi:hypothetical protein